MVVLKSTSQQSRAFLALFSARFLSHYVAIAYVRGGSVEEAAKNEPLHSKY